MNEQSIEADVYASAFIIARAEEMQRNRKIIASLEAANDNAATAIRFEMEQRGKLSLRFPAFKIMLEKSYETICCCHEMAPWNCPEVKDGQGVMLKQRELPRFIKIYDYTVPGTLRSA